MIRFLAANWIWFALIGAMLLMHRGHMGRGGAGGCGGHGSHGHDRHPDNDVKPTTTAGDATPAGHPGQPTAAGAANQRHHGC